MSTRMPIARAVLAGDNCRFIGNEAGYSSPVVPEQNANIAGLMSRSKFFDIQIASDIYLSHPEREYDLASDFGPVRLPYPDMWVEWQEEGGEEWACALSERPATANEGEGQPQHDKLLRIRFGAFLRVPDVSPDINIVSAMRYFDVDSAGRFVSGSMKTLFYEEILEESRRTAVRNSYHDVMAVAGLALSLINCKNVEVPESGRAELRRSGAEKRRKEPRRTIRYHTIILPGGGSQHDAATGGHRATALHRVRGHFKTFTTERPLMGKHVGTYWWGWQVRGKGENGMVVSDYKVGAV